jgi:hypothetical protein
MATASGSRAGIQTVLEHLVATVTLRAETGIVLTRRAVTATHRVLRDVKATHRVAHVIPAQVLADQEVAVDLAA